MENKLAIIDGSSLLYRAFYALPPTMTSPDGVPTNAVYGFLRMLLSLYRELDPAYVAVTFDKDRQTFRMEMYDGYKATRKPAPAELVPQFDLILEVMHVMGVAVYSLSGYEGDDVLGTLSARYEKELPVAIVTGDRDALQLASDRTTVYLTQKGISSMSEMTPKAVEEKYGITPSQVIDMKALMGDTADNIPGVPGIGEKTALKLLTQYKTLDNLYAHVDEIKGAQGKKLAAGKDMAYLSYKLAAIKRDVPMETTLEEMAQPVHISEMKELFSRLGINLLSQFGELPRFTALAEAKKEEVAKAGEKAEDWKDGLSFEGKETAISFDLEGTAPFFKAKGVVIAENGHAYLVKAEQFGKAAEALRKAKVVITENSKPIMETDFPWEGIPFFDTTIAAYLLDPTRTTYPLSYLAGLFKKPEIYADEMKDFASKGAAVSLFLLSIYEDARDMLKKNGVEKLYDEVEQPLVKVLAAMEKAGIATDTKRWEEVHADMKSREEALISKIYEEAGEEFNINSPKQLGHILFEKMGLPAGKKTKTGYSTAADVLEELAEQYPFVKNILEYRSLSKLISTYLEALPLLIRKETGRIHTTFNQTVTATGRLSSSDPNLQNIPVRTEEGKKIRSLFVPGEGYDSFISSDYSQVELRVLAHMSEDEGLIRAFLNKEDIHRRTAAEVMGIPFEDVTPEQRSHAKAVNFGIIYGISDFGLARQLGITRTAAADYIKAYFERYPSIHAFMNRMIEDARKTGRAVTLYGRYRELADINSKNFQRRSFAERTAMNTPIQGTAADIMKMAMIAVYDKMKAGNFKSRVLLQVHDELVAEVTADEKEAVAKLLKETMESVVSLRVPLVADVNEGKNWAETK
ncbi:DNA polymerase I [Dialister hominis]|jgi:DNA polymerase-1|uniref:DNA polymerase I n=1 Tax=Dialister hominis TaxID=2582419 RepID=UPI0003367B2A|nr:MULTISPECIES: DNA polymerase I [environmental samples]MCH3929340.1 DNA polymerase I [Dialister sp.]CDD80890.1 dNA polymerase [Dialister sp. CAG:357]HJI43339.1 DNA polymerase I [Veillonellaceae bacterium]